MKKNDFLLLFLLSYFHFQSSNLMHYSIKTRLGVIYLSKLVFLSALSSNFFNISKELFNHFIH